MSIAIVTIGLALGFAYVLVPWFRTLMAPVADLLVAARPLLIPLLVVAAAATINLHLAVQGAAALLLVLVVHRFVVKPELERTSDDLGMWWNAIENGVANALKKAAWIIIPGVGLTWIAFSWLRSDDGFLAGQGGLPAAALFVALVALAAALAARLRAYATTVPRKIVGVLLGLAVLAASMTAGIIPGYKELGSITETAATWLAIAAGVAIVVAIVLERIEPPVASDADRTRTDRFLGLGLSLGMLSGILLVLATASSMFVLGHSGDSTSLKPDRGAHATLYTDADESLEYRHAPVLSFTHDQKWTPTKVDGYVARARVLRKNGSKAATGEYTCPSIGPRSCLRITIDCPTAADPCAEALPPHRSGETVSDGAIYVRTLRRPDADDQSDQAVALRGIFRPVTSVAKRTHVLLQYWFFYPYDEWTTKILGARLTQRHEADWEAVTVGLEADDQPLFVAYSAHCGGTWKRWAETEHFGTHPLVAVANGSQANYPDAGAKRPPDFTSCTRLPRGIGALLAYAANVRDVTAGDWQWGAAEVLPVTEKQWPMSFPGTWGGNNVTVFKNARDFPSNRPSGGPASPPLQPLWQDPITTIFCDRYWDGDDDESCP